MHFWHLARTELHTGPVTLLARLEPLVKDKKQSCQLQRSNCLTNFLYFHQKVYVSLKLNIIY